MYDINSYVLKYMCFPFNQVFFDRFMKIHSKDSIAIVSVMRICDLN